MRKSLQDIKHMVLNVQYQNELPEELKEYHAYVIDSGHNIMCVLECHLDEAKEKGMDLYEIPVAVKYVLGKGYRIVNNYVVVDAPYDRDYGLMIDDVYTEY